MKQSQFYYLLRRGLFSGGSAIIKSGLVMFNKFTTAGLSFPVQGSAAFNGTSDFIEPASLPLTSFENFVFCAWVNIKASSQNNTPIGFGNTATNTPIANLDINSNTLNIVAYFRDDAGNDIGPTANFSAYFGKWAFVSYAKSGNTITLYINGSAVATDTDVNAGAITLNTFSVGSLLRTSRINYTDGNLANVAIWNRALTSDEINSVMWKPVQALTATESNGLQAWYSLDDIASPTASLASMEQLATDKDVTIENKAAITAAINSLS
tara:strand:+ start:25 stop:825 length:801 start_codon:yes stop_codon:yes gene_type:complete